MSRRVTLELVGEIADLPAGMEDMMNRVAEACCAAEGLEKVMVCARLVDDEEIWALNRRMRGVDRSTDVLSFPSVSFTPEKTAGRCQERLKGEWDPDSGRMFLGEMVISLDHAMAQAEEYGHSLSREVGTRAAACSDALNSAKTAPTCAIACITPTIRCFSGNTIATRWIPGSTTMRRRFRKSRSTTGTSCFPN